MQICTSAQTDNHASTPPPCFLQAGCPSCCPTNSVKALKATALKATCGWELLTRYFENVQQLSWVRSRHALVSPLAQDALLMARPVPVNCDT